MIDSKHRHPANLEEMVIENNAMLNKVLHNQACMMEMLCQIYQFGYKQQMGKWPSPSPTDPTNKGREKIADNNFEIYKGVVSQIFERFLNQMNKNAKETFTTSGGSLR